MILSLSGMTFLCIGLAAVVGWPALATVREAARALGNRENALPGSGTALDGAAWPDVLRQSGNVPRQAALALESARLVLQTEAIALPIGVLLAFLLFRTDAFGAKLLLGLIILAAFVPLPLHATAWLGAIGNAGRLQVVGWQPILVGRSGAAFVHAMATLPWVVLIAGIGLCAVEPELEESALLDYGPSRVLTAVTLRRAMAAIAAAALAVAVLTAGDMTVTDLLQIRTYAEESYIQYTLGRGPGAAAMVALPPLCLLGALILLVGSALSRLDPSRIASSFARARVWPLGPWRIPLGLSLLLLVGNTLALPLYGLVWRAGRVGGRATLGRGPVWSFHGLAGTLGSAAGEIWEPLLWSLIWAAAAATAATTLALMLGWSARRSRFSNLITIATLYSRFWNLIAIATLCLTLAAPGPVAGMALVLAYRMVPAIYDSPAMIVMAETFRSLPYAILLLWPFLRSLPQDYLDAAALDGLDPPRQFLRVVIPLSLRPIVAAWAIAFAIALGELAATNIATPPGVPPISVVIWGLLHTGVDSNLAGVALIVLLVVTGAGLFALGAVRSLQAIQRPAAPG
jgi:iron(III) transport system permease protein